MKSKAPASFLAIVLLVVMNNKIDKTCVSYQNKRINEILGDVRAEFQSKDFPTTESILASFPHLKCKMYVKETKKAFSFAHDRLFDIISGYIGRLFLRTILKHADSSFISNRMQFDSLCKPHDEFTIMLKTEPEEVYYRRLITDMKRGLNWEVFGNIQTKYAEFRKVFLDYMKKQQTSAIQFIQFSSDDATALYVSVCLGYVDFARFILKIQPRQIHIPNKAGMTPLHVACMKGYYDMAKMLIHNGAQINLLTAQQISPLSLACIGDHARVVSLLLEEKANVELGDQTPLHFAANKGFDGIIEKFIEKGVSLNICNKANATPLHEACCKGNVSTVTLLLEHKAKVAVTKQNGLTPLHLACRNGFINVAELLIENRSDVDERDMYGNGPLHLASFNGYLNIVDLLLDNSAIVNKKDENGTTALHLACQEGHHRIVLSLLRSNADVNVRNNDGWTPIFFSCMRKHNEIVKHLLKHGASVNISAYNSGSTPLTIACHTENFELINLLHEKGAHLDIDLKKNKFFQIFTDMLKNPKYQMSLKKWYNSISKSGVSFLTFLPFTTFLKLTLNIFKIKDWTPLHEASYRNKVGVLKLLLKLDKSLINRGVNGWGSPLLVACQENSFDVANLLLAQKASIYDRNKDGKTPLFVACENGHSEIVKLLLKYQHDVDQTDHSGSTPLFKAAMYGHLAVAKLLVDNKASINKGSVSNYSPLLVACQNGKEDIIELLLANSADANAPLLENRWTPLHMACQNGKKTIVIALLNNNADLYPLDYLDRTPLYVACQFGYSDIVNILLGSTQQYDSNLENNFQSHNTTRLNLKIEVNRRDKQFGHTPFYIASQEGHLSVLNLLIQYSEVNQTDYDNCTPLYIASQKGHTEVVEYLLNNGAEINLPDRDGRTPLYIACQHGHETVVKLLLAKDASVNQATNKGFTPLFVAYISGHQNLTSIPQFGAKDQTELDLFTHGVSRLSLD